MRNLYKNLLLALREGREAVLVTQYGPGSITKRIYDENSPSRGEEAPAAPWKDKINAASPLYFEKRGRESILAEYFLPRPRLLIFGGGHISLPLSQMAALLDFDVLIYDDRPSFASRERFPSAGEVICDSFERIKNRLSIRASDYAVIVTRGHRHDQLCLRQILEGVPPRYAGMIGSRRRVGLILGQLEEEGYSPELSGRLHSPIGLDLGAVTPEEIAVSILAEIVLEKRRKSDGAASSKQAGEGCADLRLLEWLAGERREKCALVTVISTWGSTPRKAGAKMAVLPDGRGLGSIGGGCAEAGLLRDALDVMREGGYCLKKIDLTDSAEEDGMVCGGAMEALIEALPENGSPPP
ncbi:MAG: XdhC family protein [Deltaproteobacteria bacterium]|nr:XdhC family protein [Deltaproteobacteria bacterium]